MSDAVNGKTRVYGIVGWPVSHSLSPIMQNAAFRAAGIDAVYVPFPVAEGGVESALRGLAAAGVAGVNVTVPYKEVALRQVDELTPAAQAAGAVNTISWSAGRAVGHNTDGLGFVRAARQLVHELSGKRILILGAGGAAKGVAAALLRERAELWISNRTETKAKLWATQLGLGPDRVAPWDSDALSGLAAQVDMVVNASSAGMHGKGEVPLRFLSGARPAAIDLVYAPLETAFLAMARKAGCQTQDGLAMLAAQGEIAFEFWTGQAVPQGVMAKALRAQFS